MRKGPDCEYANISVVICDTDYQGDLIESNSWCFALEANTLTITSLHRLVNDYALSTIRYFTNRGGLAP